MEKLLKSKGWEVYRTGSVRNFVDILARKNGKVMYVECKTRRSSSSDVTITKNEGRSIWMKSTRQYNKWSSEAFLFVKKYNKHGGYNTRIFRPKTLCQS